MANSVTARFNDDCKVFVSMSDDTTVEKAVIIDAEGNETDIGGGGGGNFSTAEVTINWTVNGEQPTEEFLENISGTAIGGEFLDGEGMVWNLDPELPYLNDPIIFNVYNTEEGVKIRTFGIELVDDSYYYGNNVSVSGDITYSSDFLNTVWVVKGDGVINLNFLKQL